jgi:ferritin
MLEKTIVTLIQEQINKEFFSAYLYLDIADFYASKGLVGYENWFTVQAKEEMDHALLFRTYLQNNGHAVKLSAIADPSKEYASFKEPLEASLEHERFITASIDKIYDAATKTKDYRTLQFLDWFVKEQGEEEKNSEDNILRFDLYGSDPKGLYMLDQELMARAYTPPSLVL